MEVSVFSGSLSVCQEQLVESQVERVLPWASLSVVPVRAQCEAALSAPGG